MEIKITALFLQDMFVYWKTIVIVLVPLIMLPLPLIIGNDESKCAYVALIMAIYWGLELLPLAVTALLPVVMFPLMGIMSTKDVTLNYMRDTCMMFMGSKISAYFGTQLILALKF